LVPLKKGPKLTQLGAIRTPRQQAILTEDYEETFDLVKRGIFPKTSIDNWACSAKWCEAWHVCRGKQT
jgi:hypothetical protein